MFRRILTTIVPALALALVSTAAAGQTVDELVAKNHKAKGGLEKWKSIQTMKMSGTATAQGFDLAMTIYGKRPNLGRQELQIDVPGGPQATIVTAYDGQTAWMINPMMGSDVPTQLSGVEAAQLQDQADFDGALVDWKAKGHVVELIGVEDVGGKQAHHLKVTRKEQPVQHYYLDAETGVELKIVTEAMVAGGDAIETHFSNYQTVDGILVPFAIRTISGGSVMAELKVDKVEFNVPLDDTIFRMGGD